MTFKVIDSFFDCHRVNFMLRDMNSFSLACNRLTRLCLLEPIRPQSAKHLIHEGIWDFSKPVKLEILLMFENQQILSSVITPKITSKIVLDIKECKSIFYRNL